MGRHRSCDTIVGAVQGIFRPREQLRVKIKDIALYLNFVGNPSIELTSTFHLFVSNLVGGL